MFNGGHPAGPAQQKRHSGKLSDDPGTDHEEGRTINKCEDDIDVDNLKSQIPCVHGQGTLLERSNVVQRQVKAASRIAV